MGNFLVALVAMFQALPSLVKLILELRNTTDASKKEVNTTQKLRELREAIKHAKETKDTSKLDDFFR